MIARSWNIRNSVYASSARFDANRVLTEDEMRKIAPSIFAVQAHESRSERFQPIPTFEVLKGLMSEGFMPVAVQQGNTRIEGKREFTKHMLRLRRVGDNAKYSVGDTLFEIVLKNANDGTAAYEIMAGLFRIRCLNSLVTCVSELETLKVSHRGTAEGVRDKVIDGTWEVMKSAEHALAAPQDWSGVTMNRDEKEILAEAAHVLRFGDVDDDAERKAGAAVAISPAQFLIPRRADDRQDDLWTTWNVVQERTLRGGMTGYARNENGRTRRSTAREVRGIDQNVKLNKALWILGERMAELKGLRRAA